MASVPRLVEVKVPFTVVVPAVCVKLKELPPTVKVLPLATVNSPALMKLPPVVVSDPLEASVKLPAAALLLKPAKPVGDAQVRNGLIAILQRTAKVRVPPVSGSLR